MTIRDILIHLHHIPYLSRKEMRILLQKNLIKSVFKLTPKELAYHLEISSKKAQLIYTYIHHDKTYITTSKTKKMCSVLTFMDKDFPINLRHIPDFPFVLYVIGNTQLLSDQKMISIVGTRTPTSEGKYKTDLIVNPLVKYKWTIVSGFARGIDSYAHRLSLHYGGRTIAILGGGFNYIYPKEHKYLFELIRDKGCLISEYPPSFKPQKFYFPERNRLISGISKATVLIEAKQRSGSLITIDQALEQGKDIFVMPGSPLQEETKGCHDLIQEGANLVTKGEDILQSYDTIAFY